jgi:hypothetical protein
MRQEWKISSIDPYAASPILFHGCERITLSLVRLIGGGRQNRAQPSGLADFSELTKDDNEVT